MVSATLIVGTLVLAAASVSAVPLAEREPAWYKDDSGNVCYYLENFDRLGYDVGNQPAKDFHGCDQICMDFEGCATWSWNIHNGGTCWLKASLGDGVVVSPGATSVSCPLPKKQSVNTCQQYYSVDFVGNDIVSKRGRVAECCAICDQTPGCKAYSWNIHEGGTCYLKSRVGDAVFKEGVTSSTTQLNFGPVCPLMYDTDFVGGDIGNETATHAGECCGHCKANKRCKAYTWSNYNGGTCWLKENRGEMTQTAGTISAVMQGV